MRNEIGQRRRGHRGAAVGLVLVTATTGVLGTAVAASASAETCISARSGNVCTKVNGGGTWVDSVRSTKINWSAASAVCNYSAWFYYVPPSGGAYGLGYLKRDGCSPYVSWLQLTVNRSFPKNTLVCTKWFEDQGNFIAEKCVGVS